MNIQEPDFSEMIRKSDSARRQGILNKSMDSVSIKSKQVSRENQQKTPIIAVKKTSKVLLKETPKERPKVVSKEISKEPLKQVVKKPTKVVVRKKQPVVHTSGVIYTVQIAALDAADKKYSTINNVLTYNENSLVKYSLGSFKTFNEAQKYRSQIVGKYKDAFVKALKNNVPIQLNN